MQGRSLLLETSSQLMFEIGIHVKLTRSKEKKRNWRRRRYENIEGIESQKVSREFFVRRPAQQSPTKIRMPPKANRLLSHQKLNHARAKR